MTTISKETIKAKLENLDTETLLNLLYCVSNEIFTKNVDDLLHGLAPTEIIRMTQSGNCDLNHDYFTIDHFSMDPSGKLISYTSEELKNRILAYYDYLIYDYLIENPDELNEYLCIEA